MDPHNSHTNPFCLVVNMPDSVVSTKEDYPQHIKFQLARDYKNREWHRVGPVSEHTQGMILLTDDQDFADRLNSIGLPEKYFAIVQGQFTTQDVQKFQQGIAIDGVLFQGKIKILQAEQQQSKVEIQLARGSSLELIQMFAQVSKPAKELVRTGIGPIKLESTLMPSEVRPLSTKEIEDLINCVN